MDTMKCKVRKLLEVQRISKPWTTPSSLLRNFLVSRPFVKLKYPPPTQQLLLLLGWKFIQSSCRPETVGNCMQCPFLQTSCFLKHEIDRWNFNVPPILSFQKTPYPTHWEIPPEILKLILKILVLIIFPSALKKGARNILSPKPHYF